MRGAFLMPAALWLAGCGYVGDPLPPALNVPEQITDLRGVQRGDKIHLALTAPAKSTEGLLLKSPAEIELRAGAKLEGEFEIQRWAEPAKRIPVPGGQAGMEVAVPAGEWAGKEVIFAVRAIGPTKRASQWSNLVVLKVVAAPKPPVELVVTGDARGAWLEWQGEGSQWRVWRMEEGEKEPAALGVAGGRPWMDGTVEMNKVYFYTLQQLVGEGPVPAESEMSRAASYKRVDQFAPETPAGLTAIAGLKSVELSWSRNTEADLKGYQVYRAEGDGAFRKLGELTANPSARDAAVENGKRYKYAVTAVDEAGNESRPCEAVEVIAP
ncbi:MAG: hypothetical protein HY858_08900 [Candidatus Solibacter usitatus]|nr:hypothetical protein [Candidatus Solibacter usitatus]